MKKLERLSYQQIEFVKVGFKKLGFQTVSVCKDKLCINGKKIDLVGYSNYPMYTNEELREMPLEELYDVAVSLGYNPQVHHGKDFSSVLENLGERIMRVKLKGFVYTRDENHPQRIHAILQNGEEVSLTNVLDMANAMYGIVPDNIISRSVVNKILN